ncbi:MAG: mechanosensitive ion channel family protein [Verrucomicrobiota bacterium]
MWFPRLFGCLFFVATACGQEAEPVPLPPPANVQRNIETLETMLPAIRVAEQELAAARDELGKAGTEEAKKETGKRVDTLRERTAQLRENFRTIATGVEETAYISEAETPSTLNAEIRELVQPVLDEIREATAKPREMEEMRSALKAWKARLELSNAALRRLAALAPSAAAGSPMAAELASAVKLWSSRKDESESQTRTLQRQIEEREKNTPTMWEAISGGFASFWRSRGFNLLLGLGIGAALFFIIRTTWRSARKRSPPHRTKHSVGGKVVDLIVAAVSILAAVLAVVLVFYLRGDWLLLTLIVILLLGILWASKRAIPPYIDQLRMMLDLGAVRTGERLVYNDISWRVDSLNFFCEFTNPDLRDGVLRLPIRDVLPLHSRPTHEKEPWFPSREGDWVKLDDGCFGKVIIQTPEQTIVLQLGGSRKTYPTEEYLGQNPENFSSGFRVCSTFGIDYRHLAEALETAPKVFCEKISADLEKIVGPESIRSVKVEFANAGTSSVDFEILADFAGDAASRYNVIERQLQASCAAACLEQNWHIPFPQLVIHQQETN